MDQFLGASHQEEIAKQAQEQQLQQVETKTIVPKDRRSTGARFEGRAAHSIPKEVGLIAGKREAVAELGNDEKRLDFLVGRLQLDDARRCCGEWRPHENVLERHRP